MVLRAVKHMDKSLSFNDVDNLSILSLDQGCILLFSATTISRNSSTPRSIIGGIQLNDGDRKIYHRHPSSVKITHASINMTQTLCCFVTRTESNKYDGFVAETGLSSTRRLFSLKFSRPNPIRVYLANHDIIVLMYRDVITLFRMPNDNNNPMDNSVPVDRNAQLTECIYYQWDAVQQRLHVIQKRTSTATKTILVNNNEAFVYTAYTINAKGQFSDILKIDFDLKLPQSSSNDSIFEILSSDTSLFLCWQCKMKEETNKIEYAIVSLGHGHSLYISKQLIQGNREIFQSRRVHFGLLNGDYVFAFLRGEFVHLLSFDIQLNFLNHLFFPNDDISLPYDTRYTTQRGLVSKISTLLYEKKNLITYTIEINSNEFIRAISSTTIESFIAYTIVATKNSDILYKILEKILFDMYDDLNTKTYLKEMLTALIFIRLSKRIHHNKYILTFPATTVNHRHTNDTDIVIRSYTHHRESVPERAGMTNIDKEYYDKLRTSFELSRKYRRKVSYYHSILTSMDDNESANDIGNRINQIHRSSLSNTLPSKSLVERRSSSTRMFSFRRKQSNVVYDQDTKFYSLHDSLPLSTDTGINDNQQSLILLEPKNRYLFNNVSQELQQLHPNREQGRIKELAFEYVQATQDQCDYLIKLFTRLARYDRTLPLISNESELSSDKYKPLLVILEKLYLAVNELGFSPTNEFQRTLLDLSYRVMPFDRFVDAIDQNILILTEEFVSRIILELNDDPKSYAIKEQLIFMLPNINSVIFN